MLIALTHRRGSDRPYGLAVNGFYTADGRARQRWYRTREEAMEAGERFLEQMSELELMDAPPDDVVRARHLLDRGFEPGPQIGEILALCREIQDETGFTDSEEILDQALETLRLGS